MTYLGDVAATDPDRPCTAWEIATGQCPGGSAPTLPNQLPTLPTDCAAQGKTYDWATGTCQPSGEYPPGYTPPTLPELPAGVVTETECQQREQSALQTGKSQATGDVIKTAAISAAVSAVVGAVIGYAIGR